MKNFRVTLSVLFLIGVLLLSACSGEESTPAFTEKNGGPAVTAYSSAVKNTANSFSSSEVNVLPSQTPAYAVANPYGVFIGLNPEDISRLSGYDTVVIDAAYYTAEDIDKLHQCG